MKNSEMKRTQKTILVSDKSEMWNINCEAFRSSNCCPTIKPVVVVPPTKRIKKTEDLAQHETATTIIKPFSDEVKQMKKFEKVAQPFVIKNCAEPYMRQGIFPKPLGETFIFKRKIAQVEPFNIFDDEPLDLSVNKKKPLPVNNIRPVITLCNEIPGRFEIGK